MYLRSSEKSSSRSTRRADERPIGSVPPTIGILCVLLIPITGWGQTLKVDPELVTTVREIRAQNSGAEAMEFLIGVYRTDRWADFPHFQQTAHFLEKTMRDMSEQGAVAARACRRYYAIRLLDHAARVGRERGHS